MGYIGLQRVTRSHRGFQGLREGYKGLQELPRGLKGVKGKYRVLLPITKGNTGLLRLQGLQGLQGVTRGYRK